MEPTTEALNRREAFLQALAGYLTVSLTPGEPGRNATAHEAMIVALDRVLTLPERAALEEALDTLIEQIKGFSPDEWIDGAKADVLALIYGQEAGA